VRATASNLEAGTNGVPPTLLPGGQQIASLCSWYRPGLWSARPGIAGFQHKGRSRPSAAIRRMRRRVGACSIESFFLAWFDRRAMGPEAITEALEGASPLHSDIGHRREGPCWSRSHLYCEQISPSYVKPGTVPSPRYHHAVTPQSVRWCDAVRVWIRCHDVRTPELGYSRK
jgi:hypothetical protein